MKQTKTNAMRLLERAKIPYIPHEYETTDGLLDGVSVAHKTGQDPRRVFKTLVTRAGGGAVYVFCIPVEAELPLKAGAKAAGEKNLAMLPVAELTQVTGYVKGGCSPVGMKKQYPTYIEESAFTFPTILVSGGRVGLQIEAEAEGLAKACGAKPFALSE